ncbi:Membrane protein involved in the export of O-antigen and teichoic acid [Flavobacteriaceae bacterium MAR_2010_188]|nr:Membrane protein involved in the export of O-antigen and teichoic acid [Flavobacteriaceae bacterium MAR_2010_188]
MTEKFLQDKEITKYVLSKGGITFFFRIIAMVLSFLTMWFITNFYGETVFGRYSLAMTAQQITVMVFALGIPIAFVSFTGDFSSESKIKGFFFKNLKIALLSAIVPMLFYFFYAKSIATDVFNKPNLSPYFLILAASIPFLILHETICYYFMSIKKFITYGLYLFISPNVLFIFLLVLFREMGFESYFTFLAYSLSIIITSIIGFLAIYFNKYVVEYPLISTKEILKKSFPMMLSGIFLVLLNWTDILMLGRFESESQIGIYNVAFKLGYLTLFFVASMNVVIMPKVSELFYKKNFSEMRKTVNKATQVVILLTVPLAIILIFFSKFILSFFGDGFVSGSLIMILITIGALFNAITGNVDQILNMTNNQKLVRNIFVFGFLLNVGLNLLLIPSLGIIGAATASLITNFIINTVFVIFIKKKLGFYTFI